MGIAVEGVGTVVKLLTPERLEDVHKPVVDELQLAADFVQNPSRLAT